MNPRTTLLAVGEIAAWWAALVVLWLMLISTVYTLEWVVGACAALLGALVARAGRRAVSRR
ncbi:hypothetical protein RKE30_23375 [Streptomyces sp. Li-HN-5-11]|uniref:hypothetical protein n=1 Tax=Streptomyces sp. Li-HN-5-11 TaxID=3075432 RepID=UPI0028AFA65D|nr:hypothetical protein [Streptomyces sp. Li-HN-5-11]WNM33120.1 hypothetical protein RKE30_23375 [Streptomyces sp. Li-HN-5-11]